MRSISCIPFSVPSVHHGAWHRGTQITTCRINEWIKQSASHCVSGFGALLLRPHCPLATQFPVPLAPFNHACFAHLSPPIPQILKVAMLTTVPPTPSPQFGCLTCQTARPTETSQMPQNQGVKRRIISGWLQDKKKKKKKAITHMFKSKDRPGVPGPVPPPSPASGLRQVLQLSKPQLPACKMEIKGPP